MDKAEIRIKIQTEISKTQGQIVEYQDLTKPVEPENAIGRVSRMDAINNKSVMEAALRKARLKLEKLEEAQSRIDDEDFGLCIRCKKPIPIGRILIMPQSKSCVACSH